MCVCAVLRPVQSPQGPAQSTCSNHVCNHLSDLEVHRVLDGVGMFDIDGKL
jgi:hypothetical protein